MKKRFVMTLMTAALAFGVPRADATVMFDWQCEIGQTGCATYGLSLTLGFKDAVINSPLLTFTGANSMLDSLQFSSTVGNGFTTTLADFTSLENNNFQVVFDAAKQNVLRLNDAGSDVLLWVDFPPAPGAIRFNEGAGQLTTPQDYSYYINRVQDNSPSIVSAGVVLIRGHFARRSDPLAVAEPPALFLVVAGFAGLALVRRQRAVAVA